MLKNLKKALTYLVILVFVFQQGLMGTPHAALVEERFNEEGPFIKGILNPYSSSSTVHLYVEPLNLKLSKETPSKKQLLIRVGTPQETPDDQRTDDKEDLCIEEFVVPFDDKESDASSEISDLDSSDANSQGELEDLILHPENPTDQELVTRGMVRVGQHLGMALNGLTLVMDSEGHLTLRGEVQDPRKKVFIYSQELLKIENVKTSFLSVTAPQILNVGKSRIQRLEVNGVEGEGSSTFLNMGDLKVKKFSAHNIDVENQRKLHLKRTSLQSAKLLNQGKWKAKHVKGSVQTIENDNALTWKNAEGLEYNFLYNSGILRSASLRTEGRIKNLGVLGVRELSLENHALFENLGRFNVYTLKVSRYGRFLNGTPTRESNIFSHTTIEHLYATGQVLNFGEMEVGDSQGEIGLFLNGGSFALEAGSLQVRKGENRNKVVVPELLVRESFLSTQTVPDGFFHTSSIRGYGTFENQGVVGSLETLLLGTNKFINKGRVGARFLQGTTALHDFINAEGAVLEAEEEGSFDEVTTLVNNGLIQMKRGILPGRGVNHGRISSNTLRFKGEGKFINHSEIIAHQELALGSSRFINHDLLEVGTVIGSKNLRSLVNHGEIHIQKGPFKLETKTSFTNEGTLEGTDFEVLGPRFNQLGILKGKTLSLGRNTLFTAEDKQKTVLERFETRQSKDLTLRGQFQIGHFTHWGMLDLLGDFNSSNFFYSKSRIHKGSKLKGSYLNLQEGSILEEGGEIEADSMSATSFDLQGIARVKNRGEFEGVTISPTGSLQGFEGKRLKIEIKKESEIEGLLDTDELTSTAPILVKDKGKLLARQKTQLMKGWDWNAKNHRGLTLNRGGLAHLQGFFEHESKISNFGDLTIRGMTAGIDLFNGGEALLDGGRRDRVSTRLTPQALKMKVRNLGNGSLTLTNGEFNARGDHGLVNQGRLIQDTNASLFWTSATRWNPSSYAPNKINTGKWITTFPTLLTLGDVEDMGNMEIGGNLKVESRSADAIDVLDGLKQVRTPSVDISAPNATVTSNKEYPWPITLHIEDKINVGADLRAPSWEIHAKQYMSGWSFGRLISANGTTRLFVEDFENTNGKVHGKEGVKIKFSRSFRNGGWANKPWTNGETKYKRNDSGIESGGDIEIIDDGSPAYWHSGINNDYGIILAKGIFNIKTKGKLKNKAGFIYAEGGVNRVGDIPRDSTIIARDIEVTRDGDYGWSYNETRYRNVPVHERNWLGQRHQVGTRSEPYTVTHSPRAESSDEGLILIKNGNLFLSYKRLMLLASRILCGGKIDINTDPEILNSLDVGMELPSTLKETNTRYRTDITARNSVPTGIFSKGDFQAQLGDLNSSGQIESFGDILAEATNILLTNRGRGVHRDLPAQVIRFMPALRAMAQQNRTFSMEGGQVTSLPLSSTLIPQMAVIGDLSSSRGSLRLTSTIDGIDRFLIEFMYPFFRNIDINVGLSELFENGVNFVRAQGNSLLGSRPLDSSTSLVMANHIPDQKLLEAGVPMLLVEVAKTAHQVIQRKQANAQIQETLMKAQKNLEEEEESIELKPVLVHPADIPRSTLATNFDAHGNVKLLSHGTYNADGSYGSGLVGATSQEKSVLIRSTLDHISRRAHYEAPKEDVVVESTERSIRHAAVKARAGRDILTRAKTDVTRESLVDHHGGSSNYTQTLDLGEYEAGRDILTRAETGDITDRATQSRAQQDIIKDAGSSVVEPGVELHQQQVVDTEDYYARHHQMTTKTTISSAGKRYVSLARGRIQDLTAPHIISPDTVIVGQGITVRDAVDSWDSYTRSTEEGGWFSSDETTETSAGATSSRGIKVEAPAGHPGKLHMVSTSNIGLVAPEFNVSQTTLDAVNGVVRILQGINTSFFQQHEKSSNMFWQSESVERHQHRTYTAPKTTGNITIKSKETVLQEVHGQALAFARFIDQRGGKVTKEVLQEVHEHFEHSQSGPTAALSMVIALGVSLVVGGPWGGFALESVGMPAAGALGATGLTADIVAASLAAGFGTLCSNAAVALVQHKGNVLEAAKDLTKKESLTNLVISMGTAGLTEGVMGGLDIGTAASELRRTQEAARLGGQVLRKAQEVAEVTKKLTTLQKFGDRLMRRGIEAGVSTSVHAAVTGRADLGQVGIQTVVKAVGDTLSGMAGDGKEGGSLSDFEHGTAHFGTAAVVAAVTNPDDPFRAAMVAGTSAVVSHKMAEALAPDKPTGLVTEAERTAYNEGVERAANIAKFLTPTLAMLSGQGTTAVAASTLASSTAVDYNFHPHSKMEMQREAMDEDTQLQEALERSKLEAFERKGGASGSGLSQTEKDAIPTQGRLGDLRRGHDAMEEFLAPLAQAPTAKQRPTTPPRRTDTVGQKIGRKIESVKEEPLVEGIKSYRSRKGQDANALEYVGDKALATGVQTVEALKFGLNEGVQLIKDGYHTLPQDIRRVLAPVKDGVATTIHAVGQGLEWVGEKAGTRVRRGLRDGLGVDSGIAQDAGDVVGFLAPQAVLAGVTAGTGPVIKGVSKVGGEVLGALEGTATSSGRLLHGQGGGLAAVQTAAKPKLLIGLGERPLGETVSVPGMKFGAGIQGQGMPFEEFIAGRMHPKSRLPQNFKTFDFWDQGTGLAVSVKTLDTGTAARLAKPEQVYSSLKKHIDSMVNFTEHRLKEVRVEVGKITAQELHLGVPSNTGTAQWKQIQRAVEYAKTNNINLKIYEVQ